MTTELLPIPGRLTRSPRLTCGRVPAAFGPLLESHTGIRNERVARVTWPDVRADA
jgi:hypothetical protein